MTFYVLGYKLPFTHWGRDKIAAIFPRRHFQVYFFYENVWISITILQVFSPKGPSSNVPALVQIMAWRRPLSEPDDKPLLERMMVTLLVHICVTRPQWVTCVPDGALDNESVLVQHDDVIKLKHFPRYWPFVRGIHRSPVNSPHKGQWRGAVMFTLICVWKNGCVNNREAGDWDDTVPIMTSQ